MIDDRTTEQSLIDFLSEPGSGGAGKAVDGNGGRAVAADGKPTRTRQLRATFRPAPNESTGFPGYGPKPKAFAAHRVDRRKVGGALQPAAAGNDRASAVATGSDDDARRRAAVLEAGRDSGALGPVQSKDASPAGGGIRGRPAGSGEKQIEIGDVEGSTKVITHPLAVGVRVSITDPAHPWTGHAGVVVSGPEKYGLGWYGQRLKLDGNAGESFVRPGQTDWKATSKASKAPALPAAIKKLVPKSDAPSSSSKIIPTESERQDARRLFREIGQRFNDNRKKSKTAAYAGFRHDLMDNLDTLVMGGAIDLKEATTIITNLEQYTRETEQESTETPATILGRWLRMDAAEVAALSVGVPVEEAVEDEEISGEEIDELDSGEEGAVEVSATEITG